MKKFFLLCAALLCGTVFAQETLESQNNASASDAAAYDGAEVNPDTEILVSAGSKPIIFMLLMTVLNPGDEVLVREPAWLSYKEQIRLAGGRCVAVPYYIPVEELEQYITDATKVIVINNPNNPSGYLYTREELEYLYGIAEKHNLFVLSDEAYSDFLTGEDKFLSFANIGMSLNSKICSIFV